jgi:hypothetical protein
MEKKFKKCPRCEENKEISEFGKDKRTEDGYAVTCTPCKRKNRKSRREVVEETAEIEVEPKLIKYVTPLYQYLIALKEVDNRLVLERSMSEIVDFFGFKPRIGIDLIHTFINRNGEGYVWVNKPQNAKQVAEVYAKLIRLHPAPKNIDDAVLYEQFMLLREEIAEMSAHFKDLSNSLK